ncbi:hypothetical protein Tco_0195221 [Tanacetum coccineum]
MERVFIPPMAGLGLGLHGLSMGLGLTSLTYLGKCFAMKDLGKAAFILGIKIYIDRSKRLIELSQSASMDKILKRYWMDNSKRGYIPMQERLDLNKTQGALTPEEVKRMQNVPYASTIGSIMYARLDGKWMNCIKMEYGKMEQPTTNPSPMLGEGFYGTWRPAMGYDGLPMGLGSD